jgi:hypothetical protein
MRRSEGGVTHMMGLLARPATETRTRRGEGAKESAAERTPAGGSAADAVGLGAASLDTALVIAVGVGETDEDGWVGVCSRTGVVARFGVGLSLRF